MPPWWFLSIPPAARGPGSTVGTARYNQPPSLPHPNSTWAVNTIEFWTTQRPQRGVIPAGQECTQSVPVIGNFGCTYGACVRKKEFEGKGWLMRQKEELIWDRRGAEREHGARSTARLLIFPFNHPASLARVRSALPSASLVPTDSSAGETSHTPRPTLAQVARGKRPEPPWQHGGPRSASGPTRSDPRRPIRTLIAGAGNTNDGTTRLISTVSPE